MKAHAPFGLFHICASLTCVLVPMMLCHILPIRRSNAKRILFCSGILLVILEVYKQLFLYVVVNGMQYDFWYFPFQLCSMAMYLCILLPLLPARMRTVAYTFLFSFSLPGALLALLFPDDMLRGYVSLTAHGFLWHAILVWIALVVRRAGIADRSGTGFVRAMLLYLFLCLLAVLLNIGLRKYAVYGAYPSMFYLSPYEKTGQFFFRVIAERFGIPAELILYIILYILFCLGFHAFLL